MSERRNGKKALGLFENNYKNLNIYISYKHVFIAQVCSLCIKSKAIIVEFKHILVVISLIKNATRKGNIR